MSNETCEHWQSLFSRINHYFRDDIVLNGTEHASKEVPCGNFLTMLVVILNPTMRTTRNFFIFNLALSDFFVCTVTAPMTLYTVLYMFWPFGTALCKIAGSLQGFNIFLSTFSIAAIALDRYVLVIFPTKRERQHNLSLMFFVFIWVVSLILAVPLLIASDLNTIYEDPSCGIFLRICHEQNDIWQTMMISKQTYTLSVLVTQYAFPLFSLVFAYTRIAHRMKLRFANHNITLPNSTDQNQRRRLVYCIHTIFFFLSDNFFFRKLRGVVFSSNVQRSQKNGIGREPTKCNNCGGVKTLLTTNIDMEETVALNPETDEQL
ncbi:7 transmembrane receptor [Dictyocaulus viviparus]|uniref:7 transmembrane receptor n=1 Tax=Dictyocaulus viviparus TaxID=29172 RepID=A0A0D8XEW3_DICVI|nr:7 transmembrane receptor [Dictyocaulus viviparus]